MVPRVRYYCEFLLINSQNEFSLASWTTILLNRCVYRHTQTQIPSAPSIPIIVNFNITVVIRYIIAFKVENVLLVGNFVMEVLPYVIFQPEVNLILGEF